MGSWVVRGLHRLGVELDDVDQRERSERMVLVAVPEAETARVLSEAFAFHGLKAHAVSSGAEALAAVSAEGEGRPELIVLDLAQPDADGLVLVGDLRARTRAPIIVCGEGEGKSAALLVFRLGADDYVAKPFDVDDVVARAEAALRRVGEPHGEGGAGGRLSQGVAGRQRADEQTAPREGETIVVGDLALDPGHHRVAVGSEEVRLSRSEYLLLSALMGRPDELLSRLELARAVWGEQLAQVGRPIDQHMYRLRSKLQAAASKAGVAAPTIGSVPGFGYRLMEKGERAAA